MRFSGFCLYVCVIVCIVQISHGAGHEPDLVFTCREGWNVYQGVCYMAVNIPMTKEGASATCQRQGGELFVLKNQQQFYSLKNDLPVPDSFWTSATKNDNLQSITLWANYEPMENSGDCVSMDKVNGAFIQDCAMMNNFVCQYEACLKGFVPCALGSKCVKDPRDLCNDVDNCVDKSDERNCPAKCKNYMMLSESSGQFSTQSITGGTDCWWTLEAPVGKWIKLDIPAMTLEMNVAYLQIWTGSPSVDMSNEVKKLTGSIISQDIYSSNNFLHLRLFAGDLTSNISPRTIKWTTEIPSITREETVLSASIQYKTLDFPFSGDSGPDMLQLTWKIMAPEGEVISYHAISQTGMSRADTPIYVKDGDMDSWQVIQTDTYYTTANSHLWVMMENSDTIHDYSLKYISGCTITITSLSGRILSPGSSLMSIPHEIICNWTLLAGEMPNPDRGMSIMFPNITLSIDPRQRAADDIESKDTILVYLDGNTTAEKSPVEFDKNVENIIHAPGGRINLQLNSDVAFNSVLFEADFGIDCKPLQLSAQTIKSTNKSLYGESVTLTCPDGFQFDLEKYKDSQEAIVTCKTSGFVIDDCLIIPECQVVRCGTPSRINNGYIENSTSTSYSGQAWYMCAQGFTLVGDQMVTCNEEGKWSTPPTCTSSQCPVNNNELQVSNGGYRVEAGNNITTNFAEFNIIVEFYCVPGYELIGQLQTHCGENGWSHTSAPICIKKKCLVPEVTNAVPIASRIIDFDSTLQISCLSGFTGAGTVRCLANQTLDQEITCNDTDECTEVNSCESSTTCVNTDGGYTCECLKGYGRFSEFICSDILECSIDNGGCISGTCVERSGYYECTCGNGYELFTEDGLHGFMIPESETGLLAGDLYRYNHTCVRISCPNLSNIANGKYLKKDLTSFHSNDTVTLQCDDGYHITGESQTTYSVTNLCLSGGMWSHNSSCSARNCNVLNSAPKYGTFDRTSVMFTESVTLTCNYTTTEKMTQTAHCIYDNGSMRLGGENIDQCPAIDCKQAVLPEGGIYDGTIPSSTEFLDPDSNFLFKCQSGYDISGGTGDTTDTNRVTCKVNGRWDFGTLRCLGKKCTDPRTPVDAVQIADSYEQGKMLRYECTKEGFKPLLDEQDRNYTCLYDPNNNIANWSNNLGPDNLPVCTDVTRPVVTMEPTDLSYFPMDTVQVIASTFSDNFGINTETQTNYMETGDVILNTEIFSYSVTDFSSNSATDSFTYTILDRDVKPNLNCPSKLSILVNTTNDGTKQVADFLTGLYDESATLAISPATIQVTSNKIGTAAIASVTLADEFGRKSECTFLIHYTAGRCFEQSLYPDTNALRSCEETSNGLSCNSTCNNGYIYDNGSKMKTFQCTSPNSWNYPSDLDIYCLPTENPAYLAEVNLVYTLSNVAATCLTQFQSTITNHLDNFRANIQTKCEGMIWTISVKTQGEAEKLVQFTTTLQMNLVSTEKTTQERQDCINKMEDLSQDVFNITDNNIICTQTDTLFVKTVDVSNPFISCITPTYRVRANTDDGNVCVPCGPGFYFDSDTDNCVQCSSDQYQELTNQTECKNCPSATAPDPQQIDCDNTCPPGFTSSDGFYPCEPCPVNQYWSDSKTCTPCPSPKATAGLIGTSSVNGCYDPCPVGRYSETGLNIDGCEHCPLGFYQQSTGSTQCFECQEQMTTNDTAKTSSSDCTSLESCPNGCDEAGMQECIYKFHRAVCVCKAGYGGEKCGQKHEICDADPCTDGSTCVPITGGTNTDFTCTCRTDLDRCEMVSITTNVQASNDTGYDVSRPLSKDECKQACLDEALCKRAIHIQDFNTCFLYYRDIVLTEPLTTGVQSSDFMNKTCTLGFSGDRCEKDLRDDCATAGCANGSMCMDKVNDFECLCPEDGGFEGALCSQTVNVCASNPCKNGMCTAYGSVRYLCTCNEGYTGETCETRIDECMMNPDVCLNGGACTDFGLGYHDYQCSCVSSFGGKNCEQNPDFCTENVCMNNVCWSRIADREGECACEGLFTNDGSFACNKTRQPCDDRDCGQGSCLQTSNGLSANCNCIIGWTGSKCQHNIDDCKSSPCLNGATCNDLVNAFNCSCADGFEGLSCDNNIDDCTEGICNNGTCSDGANTYTCNCLNGYTGENCETDINECDYYPCQHGGNCTQGQGEYTCTCASGWTGNNCESSVNKCGINPCLNEGICYSILNESVCRCQSGTEGKLCDEPSNLCEVLSGADLCQNDGVCLNTEGTAICMCDTEFSAERCTFENRLADTYGGQDYYMVNKSSSSDYCKKECLKQEKCDGFSFYLGFCTFYTLTNITLDRATEGSWHFNRNCPTDYSGDSCQFIKDWCSQDICENGGTCSAVSPHGYKCECQEGYSGVNCEVAADPCSPSPCSGASCRSTVTEYICQCPEGKVYTGASCKAQDTDYSLLVNTLNGEETSCLTTPFRIESYEVSVLLKIKVYAKTANPVLFNLFSGPELMPASSTSNLNVQVKDMGIRVKYRNNNPTALQYDDIFGDSLFDGEWHLIGITFNGSDGEISSVIDVTRLSNMSTVDVGQNSKLDDNVQICLGTGVLAEYANISVFDYSLTNDDFSLAFVNSFKPQRNPVQNFWNYNVQPSTKRLETTLQVSPSPGAKDIGPVLNCNGITETVEHVLDDRFVSLNGLADVTNNVGLIKENNDELTFKHSLPDELLWGYYEGIVVGMDENDNYGQCRFPVYIKYNGQCPQPVTQDSDVTSQTCESAGDGVCFVSCPNGGVAAKLPRYMPCSRLGVFDTQAPKNDLILPACNVKASPKYVFSASMQFKFTINCKDLGTDLESNAQQELTNNFKSLQTKWTNICSADCSNIRFVTTSCDTDMTQRLNIKFEVQLESSSLAYSNAGQTFTVNAEDGMRIIIKLDKDLSLSRFANGMLVQDTVEISQSEVCTTTGSAMISSGANTYCVPCGPGRYYMGTEMENDCVLCPRGMYQNDLGKMECKLCGNSTNGDPRITYQMGAISEDQCVEVCSAGQFYDEDAEKCDNCPRHYYQDEEGQNYCKPCSVGYKTISDGSTSADDCKEDCPAGKYRAATTQQCLNCSRGFWRSLEYDDCQPCESGRTTMIDELGTSALSCNMDDCPAGTYWDEVEEMCSDCDFGFFQPATAMLMCEKCPKNYTTQTIKSKDANNCTFYCAMGYEENTDQEDTCKPCQRGKYKDNVGLTKFDTCKMCTGSNTTDIIAAVSVDSCSVPVCSQGQVIVDGECQNCGLDSYSVVELPYTRTECITCTDECETCGNLYGTKLTGAKSQDNCTLYCEAGYEVGNDGNCQECNRGYYKDNADNLKRYDMCVSCQADRTTDETGSIDGANCTIPICSAGQFVDGGECQNCPEDKFQAMESPYSYTVCTECAPIVTIPTGTRAQGSNSSSLCLPICDGGKTYDNITKTCANCSMGTYKPASLKFDACLPCNDGYTTSGTGAVELAECNIRDCQPGSFINETTDECDVCPVGQYQDQPRQPACVPCGENLSTELEGSNSSDACQVFCNPGLQGETITGSEEKECTKCPEHFYKEKAGLTNCKECDPNWTSNDNRTACTALYCFFGYQYNSSGDGSCEMCSEGYYKDIKGNTVQCTQCSSGWTTNGTGQGSCSLRFCVPGEYYNTDLGNCSMCEMGSYKGDAGNQACTSCNTDKTTAAIGATMESQCDIDICPVGQFRNPSEKTCSDCVLNTYQNETGKTSCQSCSAGYITLETSSTLFTDCVPECQLGQQYNSTSKTCIPCPAGTYKDMVGNQPDACQACSTNSTTVGTGSTSVNECSEVVCPIGEYSNTSTGSVVCVTCPIGTYNSQRGQPSCSECGTGQTTLRSGSDSVARCIPKCTVGLGYDVILKKCEPCEVGQFNDVEGGVCKVCPTGKTNLASGSTGCPIIDSNQPSSTESINFSVTLIVVVVIDQCETTDFNDISIAIQTKIRLHFWNLQQTRYRNQRSRLCSQGCLNIFIDVAPCDDRRRRKRASNIQLNVNATFRNVSSTLFNDQGQEVPVADAIASILTTDTAALSPEPGLIDYLGFSNPITTPICFAGETLRNGVCEKCRAGTYGEDGICKQCGTDFYQNATGQTSCNECPENTFNDALGSPSVDACKTVCVDNVLYCNNRGTCYVTGRRTARCECFSNYNGETCSNKNEPSSNMPVILGAAIGGGGALLILLLVVVAVYRYLSNNDHKKKKKQKRYAPDDELMYDRHGYDNYTMTAASNQARPVAPYPSIGYPALGYRPDTSFDEGAYSSVYRKRPSISGDAGQDTFVWQA